MAADPILISADQGEAMTRKPSLERLAREDHQRNCPGDEPLETRSVIHQQVHENEARRRLAQKERKP